MDRYYAALSVSGQQHEYIVTTAPETDNDNDVRVTLAYTDIAAEPYPAATVINILRITIINTGTNEIYLSFNEAANVIDNVAMIIVPSPLPNSTFRITVTAVSLSSEQPYALVVTSKITKLNPEVAGNKRSGIFFFTLPPMIYFLFSMGTVVVVAYLFYIHTLEWKRRYHSLNYHLPQQNPQPSDRVSSAVVENQVEYCQDDNHIDTNDGKKASVSSQYGEIEPTRDTFNDRQLTIIIPEEQVLPV